VTVKATPQQKSRSAYEMRRMGYSWVTIAAVVGYSTGQNAQRAATKFVRSMPRPGRRIRTSLRQSPLLRTCLRSLGRR
jgi:hypothetical protein